MSRQLTAPHNDRPTVIERVTGYLWTRAHRARTYPVVERTYIDHPRGIYDLTRNPDVHRHTKPVQLSDGRWRMTVMITDRTRPGRSRARRRIHRAAQIGLIITGTIIALYTTGLAIWYLFGDTIAAALRIAASGILVAFLITVGFWWTSHGRNGCTGLHCPGCGGGH